VTLKGSDRKKIFLKERRKRSPRGKTKSKELELLGDPPKGKPREIVRTRKKSVPGDNLENGTGPEGP